MIYTYIIEHWQNIALIVTGLGSVWTFLSDKWRDKILSSFKHKVEESESRISAVNADDAVIEQINRMKLSLAGLNNELMAQSEIIVQLSDKVNTYKMAIKKLLLLCGVMCGEKEKCVDAINEVLRELNLDDNNDEKERVHIK